MIFTTIMAIIMLIINHYHHCYKHYWFFNFKSCYHYIIITFVDIIIHLKCITAIAIIIVVSYFPVTNKCLILYMNYK